MPFLEKPFWWDTAEFPAGEDGDLPERADVAVIGGGYTGLAAARALAKRGASVALLEGETLGWGASSRNGGMVLTGLKVGPSELLAHWGRELARELFAASVDSIACVESIVHEEGIDCSFTRTGHLMLAVKASHYKSFAHEVEVKIREFNHGVRAVPRDELRTEIGSDAYHGGVVDEVSAGVNPGQYVAGLARAAKRAGAKLFDRTRVQKVSREGSAFRVETSKGTVRAKEVFVATNGYTGPATSGLRRRVIPIGSYIIATEPLPEALAREVSPRDRMMFDTKNFLYYFRLTPDRRMLFGGRAGFFPATPATVRESAEILRRGMVDVYPQLRDAKVAYAWGGTVGFTFDLYPHAGRMNGLHFALGYCGHGVAMATYLGTRMADVILGAAPLDSIPFARLPFPGAPLGLYDGRPWFLPFAAVWYRFLDWIS